MLDKIWLNGCSIFSIGGTPDFYFSSDSSTPLLEIYIDTGSIRSQLTVKNKLIFLVIIYKLSKLLLNRVKIFL
ncbi:hypothetical protein CG545_000026 [Salmonella enterica]|nr:hypothetical protein [Salmonella enterica]EDQ3387712.1 hypothetical protein [Salmonella enterica subsp. houtenae]EAZ7759038.1 hypothetical protein [Salmonella enterica]EBC2561898.1 hypothetical protein [Salmonella enterica]ECC6557554.1 hypothetical protein [Salmonella enterica]